MRRCDKIENIEFCHSITRRDKIEESSKMAQRDKIEAFFDNGTTGEILPPYGGYNKFCHSKHNRLGWVHHRGA